MAGSKRSNNHPRSYTGWDSTEDRKLIEKRQRGMDISDLAKTFARTPGAIRSQLRALGSR